MTAILATGKLQSWGAMTMTIAGNADWDTYLFGQLKSKALTEDQAKALWTYTDGYLVTVKATNAATWNPNNLLNGASSSITEAQYSRACAGIASDATVAEPSLASVNAGTYCPVQTAASKTQAQVDAGAVPTPCQACRQTFCITKSAVANSATNFDAGVENAGRVADGYYCFEMDRARMDFMQYWLSADFGSVGMLAGKKAKWEVVYQAGRAVNRVAAGHESAADSDTANPYNNQAAIFPSAGNTASVTQANHDQPATATAAPASLAAGVAKLDVSWYQPKWQKNDYYQYNFRINYLDSVTVKYCAYDWSGTATSLALTGAGVAGTRVGNTAIPSGQAVQAGVNRFFPRALGMLPQVLSGAGGKYDPRALGVAASQKNAGVASNCVWATTSGVATAGPKNGAAHLAASVTALAFGAAILAF